MSTNIFSSLFSSFANWFKKKQSAPAPTPAPPTIILPPPPLNGSTGLPWGVDEIDSRGFAKLTAIEQARASDPNWAEAYQWYAIEGLGNETFEARANLTEAKGVMIGTDMPAEYDKKHLNFAYHMTPSGSGFGYVRGAQYADALSFIGDNVDANGNVIYKGIRPSDIEQFVSTCDHELAVGRERNPNAPLASFLPVPFKVG